MKKKHSITTKMTISFFLVALLAIGTCITLATVLNKSALDSEAKNNIIQGTKQTSGEINSTIEKIEQSVNILAKLSERELTDLNKFKTDGSYVNDYTERLEATFLEVANNTEGAMTFYIRFNPEYTEPTSGLFYSKSSEEGDFEKLTPTDFSQYDPSDLEHVGWYYTPINNGGPTWMDPYLNSNINVCMISYVIPIVKDGESVGIVGMDIDFSVIRDIVKDKTIYKSGFGFLVNGENAILYHPTFENKENLSDIYNGQLSKEVNDFNNKDKEYKVLTCNYNNKDHYMCYSSLENGMKYIITVEENEVNESSTIIMNKIIKAGIILIILFIVVAIITSILITNPIVYLAKVMKKAEGLDLTSDTKLDKISKTKSEIGELAKSYNNLRIALSQIIRDINIESNNMNKATDELKKFANVISEESTEIGKSVETISADIQDTSASSEEISASVEEIQANIEMLSKKAEESRNNAADSKKRAINTRERSDEAIKNSQEVYEKEKENAQKSIEEGKVVKEIDNMADAISQIAENITLLSLNAAIEAARAGDAGKGFAVVAEEIGRLAEQSQETVISIKDTIERVDGAFNNLSENNNRQLEFINNDMNEQLGILSTMSSQYYTDSEKVNAIASDLAEMAKQLSETIGQVSVAIQNTAITAQDSSESADNINCDINKTITSIKNIVTIADNQKSVSDNLNDMITKFKIDETM